jgi:hypothetical protein
MNWNYVAAGCLALWLLPQATALANAPVDIHRQSVVADIPESPTDTNTEVDTDQPPTENAVPWADLLDGDAQPPLRVGEYNRVMGLIWADLNDQRAVRSSHITAACDALGSDMRYLRGRVPRQIEDAHRQMAPFQNKALSSPSPPPTPQPLTHLSFGIVPTMSSDPESLINMIRSGEDPYAYDLYQELLWRFVALDLDDYLAPAQDDLPLSRDEFVTYGETLHREFQDPTGVLAQHEQFLQASDQLIQELLTTLQEVRRLLTILEATKANGDVLQSEIPKAVVTPSAPQLAQYTALTNAPIIERDDDTFVTRYDFLVAMVGVLSSLETPVYRPSSCGGYQMETAVDATREMQWEVVDLLRELDSLNLEILALIDTHSR